MRSFHDKSISSCKYLLCAGEKQAATHVSLDQEYDQDLAAMWGHLEEQLVAAANRGIVPASFQPTQCCLNSQTDNLRRPLAVAEGSCSSCPLIRSPHCPLLSIHPSFSFRANYSGGDVQEPSEGSSGSVQPQTPLEVHCRGGESLRGDGRRSHHQRGEPD